MKRMMNLLSVAGFARRVLLVAAVGAGVLVSSASALAEESGGGAAPALTQGDAVLLTLQRVSPRYPWNGCVDIDYTVGEINGSPTDYRIRATAKVDGADVVCRHFETDSADDLPTEPGAHHVVWNAAKDMPDVRAEDVRVTLAIEYAPITESMADYLVIDLSGGSEAATYPVRFVQGDFPSSVYNNPTYKTTKLVMKKVKADVFKIGTSYARLTHDYFLGIFEVTQEQYFRVTGKNPSGCKTANARTPASAIVQRPVEQVTWTTAMVGSSCFHALLNAKTRYRTHALSDFSLPTETQWEAAARAGTTGDYYFGTAAKAPEYEWFQGNKTFASGDDQTEIVGLRKPNPWGFYDLLGNVREWCLDYYATYPSGTLENPVVDPTGPETGSSVVYRGGTFQDGSAGGATTVSARWGAEPSSVISYGGHMNGFRVAKTCP